MSNPAQPSADDQPPRADDRGETFVIFARLAQGDPRALDDFLKRYGKLMLELAQSRTSAYLLTRVEHEDLTQKALLDLWGYREMFKPGREAEVRALAVRIVDNRIRDEARRWKARKRSERGELSIETNEGPREVGSRDPSPSRIATRDEFREQLARCLARLPDDQRRVLLLRVKNQLSLESTAAELGRTTDATAMLESRARKALRELMQREGGTTNVLG